jgi:hypothetical protein
LFPFEHATDYNRKRSPPLALVTLHPYLPHLTFTPTKTSFHLGLPQRPPPRPNPSHSSPFRISAFSKRETGKNNSKFERRGERVPISKSHLKMEGLLRRAIVQKNTKEFYREERVNNKKISAMAMEFRDEKRVMKILQKSVFQAWNPGMKMSQRGYALSKFKNVF